MMLSVGIRGCFFFFLDGQNSLSMTKVICRQSLKTCRKQSSYIIKVEVQL